MDFYANMKLIIPTGIVIFLAGLVSLSQACTVSEIRPMSDTQEEPADWVPTDGSTLPVRGSAEFLRATDGEYGGDGYRVVKVPKIVDDKDQATHVICIHGKIPSMSEKETLRNAIYKAMVESSECEVGSTLEYSEDAEVPENWLRQEGQAINEEEYPLLYRYLSAQEEDELPREKDSIICADGS